MNLNWPHIHLIISHVPVFLVLTGLVVLLLTMVIRRPAMLRTAALFLILGGLSAVAVYFTGEPTEEVLEHYYAVSDALIEPHEQAALFATIGAMVVGGAALIAIVLPQSRRPKPAAWLVMGLLAVALADAVLVGRAASLGGNIRHPEVRAEPLAITTVVTAAPSTQHQDRDDHDADDNED